MTRTLHMTNDAIDEMDNFVRRVEEGNVGGRNDYMRAFEDIVDAGAKFHYGGRKHLTSRLGKPTLVVKDHEHTPYNKRPGAVDGMSTIEMRYWKGNDNSPSWLSVILSETYRNHGSEREVSRTISIDLDAEHVDALRTLLAGFDEFDKG